MYHSHSTQKSLIHTKIPSLVDYVYEYYRNMTSVIIDFLLRLFFRSDFKSLNLVTTVNQSRVRYTRDNTDISCSRKVSSNHFIVGRVRYNYPQ